MDVAAAPVLLSTNISPWKAFNIHHPQSCMNHQITGCSACASSWGWPLDMNWSVFALPKRELGGWGGGGGEEHDCPTPSYCLPQQSLDPVSSLQSGQCLMVWNMSLRVNQNTLELTLCCVTALRYNPEKYTSFAIELEGFFLLTSLPRYASSMSSSFMLHTNRAGTGLLPLHHLLTQKWGFKLFLCDFLALQLIP